MISIEAQPIIPDSNMETNMTINMSRADAVALKGECEDIAQAWPDGKLLQGDSPFAQLYQQLNTVLGQEPPTVNFNPGTVLSTDTGTSSLVIDPSTSKRINFHWTRLNGREIKTPKQGWISARHAASYFHELGVAARGDGSPA